MLPFRVIDKTIAPAKSHDTHGKMASLKHVGTCWSAATLQVRPISTVISLNYYRLLLGGGSNDN